MQPWPHPFPELFLSPDWISGLINSISPRPITVSNCPSPLCLSEPDYAGDLMEVGSCSLCPFVSGLSHLVCCLFRVHTSCSGGKTPFFWLSSIPPHKYTQHITCPFICSQEWFAPTSCLLWVLGLCAWENKSVIEIISGLLSTYPEVQLLDHPVVRCFFFYFVALQDWTQGLVHAREVLDFNFCEELPYCFSTAVWCFAVCKNDFFCI